MKSINIYSTPDEVVTNLAGDLISIINEHLESDPQFTLALSGGNTPILLFKLLKAEYLKSVDWSRIHFFWGDERCVPPDDPDSNYGAAYNTFLKYLNIPDSNIHRIKGEEIPEKEAERYSDEIKQYVKMIHNFPQFDYNLLGIGPDGHTASIFPDQMNLLNSNKLCEVAVHPNSGQKRVTMTGKVINNSRYISIIAVSMGKAQIVSEILNKKDGYEKYPASHIKAKNVILKWYLDKESSQYLKK